MSNKNAAGGGVDSGQSNFAELCEVNSKRHGGKILSICTRVIFKNFAVASRRKISLRKAAAKSCRNGSVATPNERVVFELAAELEGN